MRIITDGTRTALVGPGYICTLDTPESVEVVQALAPVVAGNARQYDLWAAACLQGRVAAGQVGVPADLAAQVVDALGARIGGAR